MVVIGLNQYMSIERLDMRYLTLLFVLSCSTSQPPTVPKHFGDSDDVDRSIPLTEPPKVQDTDEEGYDETEDMTVRQLMDAMDAQDGVKWSLSCAVGATGSYLISRHTQLVCTGADSYGHDDERIMTFGEPRRYCKMELHQDSIDDMQNVNLIFEFSPDGSVMEGIVTYEIHGDSWKCLVTVNERGVPTGYE
jgi:hypothetical protein